MIKVAGLWELGWNTPLAESYLWQFVLRDFEIFDWYMAPISGVTHTESGQGLKLIEYTSMQSILDEHTERRVFVDEMGETDLREFEHPEDAIYVFGNAGQSPMHQGFLREGDLSVRIPTVQNKGVLWPHQCLLAVMYDRIVKGWQ